MSKRRKKKSNPPRPMPRSVPRTPRKRRPADDATPDLRDGFLPLRCYGIALGNRLVMVDATPADEEGLATSLQVAVQLSEDFDQKFRVAECLILEVR